MSTSSKKENPITELLDELDKKGVESLQKVLQENRMGTTVIANTITGGSSEKTPDQTEALDKLGKDLISIINNGANEFKKKTEREMTYSEMREAYG
jgi:hypothetical protein